MAGIEALKKITLGACNAQPDSEEIAKMEKSGKPLAVLDVYGIARRYKPGATQMGEYVKFLGQFRAVNLVTKDRYESSTLILPKFLEEQLYSVMGTNDAPQDVQFAFRISAKFNKKAATKYEYVASSLTPPAENDPLVILENRLQETKALAAPA